MVLDRVLDNSSVMIDVLPKKEADFAAEVVLPMETDLPEEYRNRSIELTQVMKEGIDEFSRLEPRVDSFEATVTSIRLQFEQILIEGPNAENVETQVTELKSQILKEIQTLVKIRKLLLESGDATSLLDFSISDKGSVYKFGKVRNPLQWIDRTAFKRQPNYTKEKEDFTSYQWSLFNQRVKGLKDLIRGGIGELPQGLEMPSAYGWDISSGDFESRTEEFATLGKEKSTLFREKHIDSTNKKAVLDEIRMWLHGEWSKDINLATVWDKKEIGVEILDSTIDVLRNRLDTPDNEIKNWLEHCVHSAKVYKGSLLGKALDLGELLNTGMCKQELVVNDPGKESYMQYFPYCGSSLEEFNEIEKLNAWLTQYREKNNYQDLGLHTDWIGNIANALMTLSEANKQFAESQDLMWHGAPPEFLIDKVIVPGFLLARSEQMRKFGEANFASGNMQVKKVGEDRFQLTEDFFPYSTSVQVMNEKDLRQHYGSRHKRWFEEYNQVCFSREFIYHGEDPDIALCFSKASLVSNRQFMLADGWHIFDENYSGTPESQGLQINLTEEPHLLVVVRSNALSKLKESLMKSGQQGKVLGNGESVEDWINQHVIEVESMKSEDDRQKIKQEFQKRFPQNRKQGCFMPTGISAPETPGVQKPKALVTYLVK